MRLRWFAIRALKTFSRLSHPRYVHGSFSTITSKRRCSLCAAKRAGQKRFTRDAGIELRSSVSTFVAQKILATRAQHPGQYANISCLRGNAMKSLPNFFARASLAKLFFCFPDPHFKARKHKARIVSPTLVAEYAYVLRPGGVVYTITDVEDLSKWMADGFGGCELFERVAEEELEGDVAVEIMKTETEEGKKVERNGGRKWVVCFRRKENPGWPE